MSVFEVLVALNISDIPGATPYSTPDLKQQRNNKDVLT